MTSELLSVKQFAKRFPALKSEWAVHEYIRKDLIPHSRIGGRIFIDLEMWDKFCNAGGASDPGTWRKICGISQAD